MSGERKNEYSDWEDSYEEVVDTTRNSSEPINEFGKIREELMDSWNPTKPKLSPEVPFKEFKERKDKLSESLFGKKTSDNSQNGEVLSQNNQESPQKIEGSNSSESSPEKLKKSKPLPKTPGESPTKSRKKDLPLIPFEPALKRINETLGELGMDRESRQVGIENGEIVFSKIEKSKRDDNKIDSPKKRKFSLKNVMETFSPLVKRRKAPPIPEENNTNNQGLDQSITNNVDEKNKKVKITKEKRSHSTNHIPKKTKLNGSKKNINGEIEIIRTIGLLNLALGKDQIMGNDFIKIVALEANLQKNFSENPNYSKSPENKKVVEDLVKAVLDRLVREILLYISDLLERCKTEVDRQETLSTLEIEIGGQAYEWLSKYSCKKVLVSEICDELDKKLTQDELKRIFSAFCKRITPPKTFECNFDVTFFEKAKPLVAIMECTIKNITPPSFKEITTTDFINNLIELVKFSKKMEDTYQNKVDEAFTFIGKAIAHDFQEELIGSPKTMKDFLAKGIFKNVFETYPKLKEYEASILSAYIASLKGKGNGEEVLQPLEEMLQSLEGEKKSYSNSNRS